MEQIWKPWRQVWVWLASLDERVKPNAFVLGEEEEDDVSVKCVTSSVAGLCRIRRINFFTIGMKFGFTLEKIQLLV
jgi:hypothetical protein